MNVNVTISYLERNIQFIVSLGCNKDVTCTLFDNVVFQNIVPNLIKLQSVSKVNSFQNGYFDSPCYPDFHLQCCSLLWFAWLVYLIYLKLNVHWELVHNVLKIICLCCKVLRVHVYIYGLQNKTSGVKE